MENWVVAPESAYSHIMWTCDFLRIETIRVNLCLVWQTLRYSYNIFKYSKLLSELSFKKHNSGTEYISFLIDILT